MVQTLSVLLNPIHDKGHNEDNKQIGTKEYRLYLQIMHLKLIRLNQGMFTTLQNVSTFLKIPGGGLGG